MQKYSVLGARGMLGVDLMMRLGARGVDAVGLASAECDVTDAAQVEAAVEMAKPTAIVNCAAYTNVDGAEADPDAARRLNSDAVEYIGRAGKKHGAQVISISTDYVFHGRGDAPFPEDARPEDFGPASVYGRTKREGEERLEAVGGEWCVARTAWLYGKSRVNFVEAIANAARTKPLLKVVGDQIGPLTWTVDVSEGIEQLIKHRATGYYHLVNSGAAARDVIARRIVELLGLNTVIEACATSDAPRPAERPLNSRLSQDKYAALAGAPLRDWDAALSDYLKLK